MVDKALEASLAWIVEKLDQPYELEPDRQTLGTNDSTCSSVSEEDDLSFISYSEDFCEIVKRLRSGEHITTDKTLGCYANKPNLT